MMRVVDTSVLYALFNNADPHHDSARAAFADPTPIGIPLAILQETLDLIRYRQGKPAAVAAYDAMRSLPQVRLLDAAAEPAVSSVWKGHTALSHADAGAIVTAWHHESELLTTDAKQRAVFKAKARQR